MDEARPTGTLRPRGPASRFRRSLAVVLGVDDYEASIPPLRSAVSDARAVGEALGRDHGFEVRAAFDGDVSLATVDPLIDRELSDGLGPEDRLLFYFAGHGVALDGDDGPAGYLLLHDARRDDPATFLSMRALHRRLTALPCRHALIVLDCCFAGSFRWSSLRHATAGRPGRVYRERYDRYVDSPAWQVLTSAAGDQLALDRLSGDRGERGGGHSPFAAALLRGLGGEADYTGDGLITGSELGLYAREQVELLVEAAGRRQTPLLFDLDRHDRGEFCFQVPGRELDLPRAPPLSPDRNPYRGLQSYEEGEPLHGRDESVARLADAVDGRELTIVVGPSGCGKSSLVKAGLLPVLRARGWRIARPMRPSDEPLAGLRAAADELAPGGAIADPAAAWLAAVEHGVGQRTLVVVDQLEELITHGRAAAQRDAFVAALADGLRRAPGLRIVVTIRSDVEAELQDGPLAPWWKAGRFPVPPMTRAELRAVIERPASDAVLYFEPGSLVDRLIDDVALLSQPLPLLSFALSELYRSYWDRRAEDRALRESDYDAIGGVTRALTRRASALHDELVAAEPAFGPTVRNAMLRMTATIAGQIARRRVPRDELVYPVDAENRRVDEVLERFQAGRLLVRGSQKGADGAGDEAYVEPAHDELVRGWDRVRAWIQESAESRALLGALAPAVAAWRENRAAPDYLWHGDPRLPQAERLASGPAVLFNRDEDAFVRASRARRRRARRTTNIVWATVGSVVMAAAAVATFFALRASTEAERATRSAAGLRAQLALSDQEQGRSLLLAGDPVRALPYLVAARELGVDTPALRLLFGQARQRLYQVEVRHDAPVYTARFSRDGARLVTASADGTARVWDAATGRPITPSLRHDGPVMTAELSPDGTQVITASDDHTARLWDARTGQPIAAPLAHGSRVLLAEFSPDGTRVLTATDTKVARVWDASTGQPVTGPLVSRRKMERPPRNGYHMQDIQRLAAFNRDGTRVLAASPDRTARIWDAATGAEVVPALEHPAIVQEVAYSPDGSRFATVTVDQRTLLWDATTGKPAGALMTDATAMRVLFSPDGAEILTIDGRASIEWSVEDQEPRFWPPIRHTELALAGAFSPDGARIATGGAEYMARVWMYQTAVSSPLPHDDMVWSVAFSPDGRRVLTASEDHAARIWDASTGAPLARLWNRAGYEAFSPDGARAVIGIRMKQQFWDVATGRPATPEIANEGGAAELAFSRDGARAFTFGPNLLGPPRIWNATTGQPAGALPGAAKAIASASFSDDGRRLVTTTTDRTARLWDAATAAPLSPTFEHAGARGPVLDATGARVVVVTAGAAARILDARTGQPLAPPFGADVTFAAFSPDGARVVTASADRLARVWDASTGAPIGPPLEHQGGVVDASFDRQGRRVVTAANDHTVRIWDAVTGAIAAPPLHHDLNADRASFSPDGALVLTVAKGARARVWDAASGKQLAAPFGDEPNVVTAAFTPDGRRVITVNDIAGSALWDLSPDPGTLDDWRALLAACVPYELRGGILVPRAGASMACPARPPRTPYSYAETLEVSPLR